MQNTLVQFGGSLLAVLAMVALTWFMGFRHEARLASEDEARELMRLVPGGFEPVAIGIASTGRTAIGRDAEGRLLLLIPHGNQFVARLLPEGTIPQERDGALHFVCEGRDHAVELGSAARDWATTDINGS